MAKPKYKVGDTFFHPTQRVFVVVDDKTYQENKGYLYTLKVYNHNTKETSPFKRYYEDKMKTNLQPLANSKAVKALYETKKK